MFKMDQVHTSPYQSQSNGALKRWRSEEMSCLLKKYVETNCADQDSGINNLTLPCLSTRTHSIMLWVLILLISFRVGMLKTQ